MMNSFDGNSFAVDVQNFAEMHSVMIGKISVDQILLIDAVKPTGTESARK